MTIPAPIVLLVTLWLGANLAVLLWLLWIAFPAKPRDTGLDAINAQIADARRRHAPVAHLLAARTALLHAGLRAAA